MLGKGFHNPLDDLGLARQPERCQQGAQGLVECLVETKTVFIRKTRDS
jgi:hypothetical protein